MIADLQNQQATTATQNSTLALAPVLTSAFASRPPKVYVAKPPDFDSNDYNTFKQVIEFYLLAAHQDFVIEQDQILFILSHMKREYTGI